MASVTYQAKGNREHLNDFITNISPLENKLQNRFGRTEATATYHEFMLDSLRPAKVNAQLELATFGSTQATPRVRMGNYVQAFMVDYVVSDQQEKVKKAGVTSEKAYQMVKASKELSRDLELAIVSNATTNRGSDSTAGKMGGIKYFVGGEAQTFSATAGIITWTGHQCQTGQQVMFMAGATAGNVVPSDLTANTPYYAYVVDENTINVHTNPVSSLSASGFVSVASGGSAYIHRSNLIKLGASTDMDEDAMNDAMYLAWKQGGSVDSAIVSGRNKRLISTWTAGTMKTRDMSDTTLKQVVDVYISDMGEIAIEAHRDYADDRVDLLEFQGWKLAFLLPFKMEDVARNGTFTKKVITGSCTVEGASPYSNAAIINITALS